MTPAILASYAVAILAKMTLTSTQVTTLTDWANTGGNLIAMGATMRARTASLRSGRGW